MSAFTIFCLSNKHTKKTFDENKRRNSSALDYVNIYFGALLKTAHDTIQKIEE